MNNYKKYIFTGIMSIIPVMLTTWIIQKLFIFFSIPGKYLISLFLKINVDQYYYLNQVKNVLEYIFGFILTIIFLYFLGIVISNVLGKRLYKVLENILDKIPIVNKIYTTIKNITETFTNDQNKAFQKVVLLEYPRKGLWTLAMVTGECLDKNSIEYYNLFVPTTPNPTSGYLIITKKTDIIETQLSVDDGLSIIISGGMVSPEIVNIK